MIEELCNFKSEILILSPRTNRFFLLDTVDLLKTIKPTLMLHVYRTITQQTIIHAE